MSDLTLMQNIWALAGGFLTGGLFQLVGSGGSALAVPILTTLVGLTRVRVAMGTTAVATAATALMSAALHARRGTVVWPAVLSFAVPGTIGIFLGSRLQNDLPSHVLLTLLGVVLLANAGMMARMTEGGAWASMVRQPYWVRFGPVGLAVGVLAGMFGMGGGFLAVPSMMLGGLSLTAAASSSVVSVGSLGLVSAIHYTLKGLVDWRVVVDYVAGGFVGSLAIQPLARTLGRRKRTLSVMVTVMLALMSVYLIVNNMPSALHATASGLR